MNKLANKFEELSEAASSFPSITDAFDLLHTEEGQAQPEAWRSRRFDPDAVIAEPEPVYKLADATVCTVGNLTNLHAQAKAGKSAVIGAMIAAVIQPESATTTDTLSFSATNPDGKAVVHFDTEQTEFDHSRLIRNAMRRAKVDSPPPWLHSYWLKGMSAEQCRQTVAAATTAAARECGGVHSIFIDGVADLANDVNDASECNPLVTELEAIACEFNCSVVVVIHCNPGSVKVRGHLGSQLERKAESNLTIEKGGKVSVIFSEKQRGAPILKDQAPRFQWDDSSGMHISCESAGDIDRERKIEQWRNKAEDVFEEKRAMRYGDLSIAIKERFKVAERTADRWIKDWGDAGIIQKSLARLWELKS
jgi:hypothetical protein